MHALPQFIIVHQTQLYLYADINWKTYIVVKQAHDYNLDLCRVIMALTSVC